jgi:16S rRNA U1498 N3-methylase RsmE
MLRKTGINIQFRLSDLHRVITRVCEKTELPILADIFYSIITFENSVIIIQLMTRLGHEKISSTMIYSSISNNKLQSMNNNLP